MRSLLIVNRPNMTRKNLETFASESAVSTRDGTTVARELNKPRKP
jgi:hypothetical protein